MTKYNFILLSGDADSFLQKLQKIGIVDITRTNLATDERISKVTKRAEELQRAIEILKSVPQAVPSAMKHEDAANEVIRVAAKKETLSQQFAELNAALDELKPWGDFNLSDIERLETDGLKYHFYKVRKSDFKEIWHEQYALTEISEEAGYIYFVIISYSDDFSFVLNEMPKPERAYADVESEVGTVKSAIAECDVRLSELKSVVADIERELDAVRVELDRLLANASGVKAADDYLIVFEGFAPNETSVELQKALESESIFYIAENAKETDNPPIKLKNNRFVSMFELLTDMYGRPKYSEFDPTIWISIFFMLFFAFCMGDAGYGLLLIALGLGLKGKMPKVSPLVVTLGVATFVIGFMFHTFFSTDMLSWNCIPSCVKKLMLPHQIAGFDGTMVMAIAVGVVHICLAMILKTWQATKHNGINSLGTWGWTLLIVGGVVAGGLALAGIIDSEVTKLIIIVLGVLSALGIFFLNDLHRNPLLNFGVGLWNTYNTATGLLGDVLSYLRLYALGLAGAKLGEAFNAIGAQALGDGGFGWVFFILIVVVGHTLNLAMCALGAFVHPLRLNFLEFFKNSGYEGTGRKYNPLTENVNS